MRPSSLEEIVGQDDLVAAGRPLRTLLEAGRLESLILCGPPGVGKTTMARIIAHTAGRPFIQLSAIFSGVADLRKAFATAEQNAKLGQGTVLFVDEIHRFNRAQQDSFLPVMEDGTITLIGATTENPSFSLNPALLSRATVLTLKRLDVPALEQLLERAEAYLSRKLPLSDKDKRYLLDAADGDGRYFLAMVDRLAAGCGEGQPIDSETIDAIIARRPALYDAGQDAHYNLASALQKSIRGSDTDAALYWTARMLEGGEDPRFILRRLTVIASEDVGNADPQALPLVIAARQAYEALGDPEGHHAIGQAVSYLASAPKSNAAYAALKAARKAARENGSLPPPKHALNAPTEYMKAEGFSDGYVYDHDTPDGFAGLDYFPDTMERQKFYDPAGRGAEKTIKERLLWYEARRRSRN